MFAVWIVPPNVFVNSLWNPGRAVRRHSSIRHEALVITADQEVVVEDVTRDKLAAKESRLLNAVRIVRVRHEVHTFFGIDDQSGRRRKRAQRVGAHVETDLCIRDKETSERFVFDVGLNSIRDWKFVLLALSCPSIPFVYAVRDTAPLIPNLSSGAP
jgi:hypothetical protein